MPFSFSFVLPRSPNRYGLVQKSAACTPPPNSDEKAIPTPHAPVMFTNLRNICLVLPPSQALLFLPHVPAQSPRAWNVLLPQHTRSPPPTKRLCASTGAWIHHAWSPVLAGNASTPRGDAPCCPCTSVDLGAVRAMPAS